MGAFLGGCILGTSQSPGSHHTPRVFLKRNHSQFFGQCHCRPTSNSYFSLIIRRQKHQKSGKGHVQFSINLSSRESTVLAPRLWDLVLPSQSYGFGWSISALWPLKVSFKNGNNATATAITPISTYLNLSDSDLGVLDSQLSLSATSGKEKAHLGFSPSPSWCPNLHVPIPDQTQELKQGAQFSGKIIPSNWLSKMTCQSP